MARRRLSLPVSVSQRRSTENQQLQCLSACSTPGELSELSPSGGRGRSTPAESPPQRHAGQNQIVTPGSDSERRFVRVAAWELDGDSGIGSAHGGHSPGTPRGHAVGSKQSAGRGERSAAAGKGRRSSGAATVARMASQAQSHCGSGVRAGIPKQSC